VTYRFTRAPAQAGALLFMLVSTACLRQAHADERPPDISDTWTETRWTPQPVRYPVAFAQVQPEAPHVPEHVGTVEGVIELGPAQAAALWLDALDVVRVRRVEAASAESSAAASSSANGHADAPVTPAVAPELTIVAWRVAGPPSDAPARARADVEESPVLVKPGLWHLAQPPERGDVWVIAATAPMRVVIERPVWRADARQWEDARAAILRWILDNGPMPSLPAGPGRQELAAGLRADHALAQLLVQSRGDTRGFRRALREWRCASALTRLATVGAYGQPYHWFEEHTAALAAGRAGQLVSLPSERRPYARAGSEERTWSVTIEGPGALEIDVRALLPEQSHQDGTGLLRVTADDLVAGEHRFQRRPAYVNTAGQRRDPAVPERAWLRAPNGGVAGPRERVRVALLPGKRTYRLALSGGDSLVRVRVVRRRPRLIEVLRGQAHPSDCIAAASDALARDHSAEAALLAQLLAELHGSSVDAATSGLPPLLALVADISRRRGREIDRDALNALLAQAQPVLDRVSPDLDPALPWSLRRDLLELAARANAPDVLDALTAAVDDVPPIIAARMAELVALTAHGDPDAAEPLAWALAAAQHAWQAAPLDPSIRQMYLRTWRLAPPWARLDRADTGELLAEGPELPLYRFIEHAPDDRQDDTQEETPAAPVDRHTLWPIVPGQRQRVLAQPSPVDHRRPVVIRVYVATPHEARGSVRLHVGDQVLTALPLEPVEVLSVAVPPGVHEVMLEAPAGTEAFLSATPEDPAVERTGMRRRRPAWDHGHAARFAVPAEHDGVPVRMTLRVAFADAHGTEPVRVRLHTDMGHTRSIAVQPGPRDTSWIPVDGAAPVSVPVRTVLWLPPGARSLWLEPEQPELVSQLWASLALRRTRSAQPAPGTATAIPDDATETAPADPAQVPPATGEAPARTQVPAPGSPEWKAIVAEIAELSRALVATPDDVSLRLRRAHRLLDLGEVGRVSMDWAWITARPPERLSPGQGTLHDQLARRLADWRDPRYLPVQPEPFEEAVALAPAFMALVSDPAELGPWLVAAAAARQGDRTLLDSTAREHETLLARYFRAELLRREGAHAQAAAALRDIYEQTRALAIGVEALLAFEAALAGRPPDKSPQPAPATELASLAYGLALDMHARFTHPVVRRVLFAAARSSRWEPLRGTEGSAGFESLHVDEELLDPEPDALLERALLAPPWPREQAGVVHPGRGALLSLLLQTPARVRPEAWCQRIRPAEGAGSPACAVRWRVTGQPERAIDVPLAQVTPLGSATLAAGRHELEVVLAHDDPTVRLVVRFATSRAIAGATARRETAISALRPGRMHVADAEHPVTATVLGPTTIRVEARRYMDEPPVVLVAEARPAQEGERATALVRQVRVDAGRDLSALGSAQRNVQLSGATTSVLVLPAQAAYRVELRPQQGRALVRLWHRRDVPGASVEAPPAQDAETPPLVDTPPVAETRAWPAAIEPGDGAIAAPWRRDTPSLWPTLSAGLSFRRDDLADRDVEDEPLENRLQLDLAWRRQLVPDRFWVRVESALRWHPGSTPAYGGAVDLAWRRLPLDLRLDVMGRAYAQSAADTLAWTAQSRVRVGRAFRLRPSLTLVPGLAAHARVYSLDAAPGAALDPLVFNDYDRTHRFGLRPEATLYWRPLQDQLGLAGARLVTNENFYNDRLEIELAWRGIAPWPGIGFPLFELHYRPGYRYVDLNRSRDYVRHDVGIRLDWTLWNGRDGRWLLEVRDEAYLSTAWGNRNVFLIGLRYDLVAGRGLRDMLPTEYRFDELIEPPPWAH
jgi:hypothetical protein